MYILVYFFQLFNFFSCNSYICFLISNLKDKFIFIKIGNSFKTPCECKEVNLVFCQIVSNF